METVQVNRFVGWLLPRDPTARRVTRQMLMLVGVGYIIRILIHLWLDSFRSPFGSMWWIILPIACLAGIGLATVILALAVVSLRKAHHIVPAFVLLGGMALVLFLPVPLLPRAVFPEQEFFLAHRAEFDQVVNLAREDKLNCIETFGCGVLARELPTDYAYLSQTGFVQVDNLNSSYLTVTFFPTGDYYPVVYFQVPEYRNSRWHMECNDITDQSRYKRKLDEHWFLCAED